MYKCIAILLVVFAVLISALRLLLPYAHNYRSDLQDYINQTYDSNIIIGSLNMGWQSSGPTLVAANVSLLQTEQAEVYIQAFDISFDFWQSLRQRRLITTDFSLDGVKVLFDKTAIESNTKQTTDSSLIDNVSELFLVQIGRFSVINSQVIYRSDNGERTFLISSLDWQNNGDSHLARGNVILDSVTSNNLNISLDIKGQKLKEMQGTLHLKASQLNITPWFDRAFAIEDENTHSAINFDAWLSIEKGQSKQLLLALGENKISWQQEDINHSVVISNGKIALSNLDRPEHLHVFSSDIEVETNDDKWQPVSFDIKKNFQQLTTYINNIDVKGAVDLLPLFIQEQEISLLVEQLNPTGMIEDIYVNYEDESFSVVSNFSHMTSLYSQGIPGIENVSGELVFQDNKLHIDLLAQDGALDFDKHFQKPIQYNSLTTKLDVDIKSTGWLLSARELKFNSEQLSLFADLAITAEQNKELEMSLLATATEGNVIFAQTFYPHLLMGDDLVNYLNGALVQGQLEQAVVLINGPLSKFPFAEGNGTFVVDAELNNATFKFDSQWPAINHFDANLNFTNNSMLITGRDGTLSGIEVLGVKAAIADLANSQILTVDANFSETAPELVSNLMLTSPFDDTVGTVLEQVVVGENIAGSFHLSLPLNDLSSVMAKGRIDFNDNIVDLQTPTMHFNKVNGSLEFVNEKITAKGLRLDWRGMPLVIDVSADSQDVKYQTNIELQASWQEQQWLAQVPKQLTKYGKGIVDWQGILAINNYHNGQFDYQLSINSELPNTVLTLPSPYSKSKGDILPAVVSVSGDEDQSIIDAKVGEKLKFYGNLNHQQVAFSQAHLILGSEEMYLPLNGFHITTKLEQAQFEPWQILVTNILDSIPDTNIGASSEQVSLLSQPERIRGNVEQLHFLGESIHGVSFNLEDQLSWWLLELTSKEARAKVKLFPDWHTQGLSVDADFFRLAPDKQLIADSAIEADTAKEGVKIPFDIRENDAFFANFPPLQVTCGDCSYGNLELGNVAFSVTRTEPTTLTLNNFVAKRKNNKLTLDGSWHHDADKSVTQLVGDFSTNDIEREFERLGIPSTVRDSGLKSTFNINWLGGPQNFAVANFNGDLSGKLDEGYLAEVPDQARAFSILSLQSLVRKLKFDFRDIFSDGMFYSEVKGDFHIQNGVIYTKNTFLKGAAGDLTVKGNTDLTTQMLDYSMSYKPNVTSSLPAIAWIATLNPVTFLAGIAIDEVITSTVVSEYKIEVTGSIDEPNIKEVDRKTQNISVGRDSPPQIVENLPVETNQIPRGKSTTVDPNTGLIIDDKLPEPDKSDG